MKYKAHFLQGGVLKKTDSFFTVDTALQKIREWTLKTQASFCFIEENGKWVISISRWNNEVIFETEKCSSKITI